MNAYLAMLLEWARSGNSHQEFCAHGWLLRDQHIGEQSHLDPVDAMYARNILMARMAGVSA